MLGRALSLGQLAWARLDPWERHARRVEWKLREAFYGDYWEAVAARLDATHELLGAGLLRLRMPCGQIFVRGQFVQIDDRITLEIAGNKALSQQLLRESDFPTPRFRLIERADGPCLVGLLSELGGVVVCKPAHGAGGRAITTGIETASELRGAIRRARRVSPAVIVEEQVKGENYRLLYLGGRLIDAIHRGRPTVVGDGRRSIRELVRAENASRAASAPASSLSLLRVNSAMKHYLRARNMGMGTIPEKGAKVVLSDVVNQNAARDNYSMGLELPEKFLSLGARLRRCLPVDFLGVDIISPDIADPEAGYFINEINTTPAFHHHVLVRNPIQSQPIGERVCRFMLQRAGALA